MASEKEEKLLERIRERFDYAQEQWQEIRQEAKIDMEYYSGNPWPAQERIQRKQAGRPCLVMDELSQYVNQVVNDIRQNKRAVKVNPRGYGANDKVSEVRGDLIREIEYKSNAQSAYCCAFENMCARSYGGWKITRRYISDKSFNQEIRIVRIPNPDSSFPDPDCKEVDYSDARYWYLLDQVPRKEYKRKYPEATITDFTGDHMKIAPTWIKEDQIQVAEYWEVEVKKRRLLEVLNDDGSDVFSMYDDELPNGETYKSLKDAKRIRNEREVEERKVCQYITNGVEILEENPQPGRYIPIIWLTGKELYVDTGSGPKRMLMSMIRLARDPQMMVNYLATCEAEVVGMTPKVPWMTYVGQVHNPEKWQTAHISPVAFLEAHAKTEESGPNILPLPSKPNYEPQVQQLELAREANRRSIQSAMGTTPLPTNVQKLNDKSGVALKEIDANEDRGTFHFIDNYEMALEHSGRVINDLIPHVYDAPRDIGLRKRDETHRVVRINDSQVPDSINITEGEHEVTITSGPSFQSEREAANDFVDTVIPELESLPIDPIVKQKLLALLIKLKNVGPIGDEIVEMLDPKNATTTQLQTLQVQSQQYQTMLAELQAENQKLYAEKQGKIVDNEYMLKKASMDNELKLAIAEITTKAQSAQVRAELESDLISKIGVHLTQLAHEAATQALEHQHEHSLAEKQAAIAQASGSNGAGGEQE